MKKEFKNLDEQIEILRNKGLKIDNNEYTKEVLFRENYFFLNGYRHLLMRSNVDRRYIEGSTFEELYSLFLFDRVLRNILFKNILIVENNIKSIISYQLSIKYGYREKDYLVPKNFTANKEKSKQVADILRKMKRQINLNATQHSATSHYVTNYGYIPLWVLVKVLSFGIVGELYSILKKEDQLGIAEIYNMDVDTLLNYLTILSNYRNLCAHEDILFSNKTQRNITDNKYHKLLNIPIMDDEYIYGKNDVFALVIILRQMLSRKEFSNLMEEIKHNLDNLELNLHSIKIDKVLDGMGFPKNYYDLKNIDEVIE
ncbi:MAG: Abi family protein [Bacilli bacterium]|nr:Abi family protein [Bacilli bacterium]